MARSSCPPKLVVTLRSASKRSSDHANNQVDAGVKRVKRDVDYEHELKIAKMNNENLELRLRVNELEYEKAQAKYKTAQSKQEKRINEQTRRIKELEETVRLNTKAMTPELITRKTIDTAMEAIKDLNVLKKIDNIVDWQYAFTSIVDVSRQEHESNESQQEDESGDEESQERDNNYYARIKSAFGFVPHWSMSNIDLAAEHPFGTCKAMIYSKDDKMVAYKIDGGSWFDLYVAASACVVLAEGPNPSRYIEGFTKHGKFLDVFIGT